MRGRGGTTEDPGLDLKRLENLHDPFPVYRRLRDEDPIHWSPSLKSWVVTRYRDVLDVFSRPGDLSSDRFRKVNPVYASRRPAVQAVGRVLAEWLVFRDPPDHTRLRGLLQKTFTPTQLEKNRERIRATIDGLLDRVEERGEMDFIRDFAFPLPALVIALLLGAPAEDIESIKRWSDQLAAYLGGSLEEADNFTEARQGVGKLVDYFRDLLAARKRNPADDLTTLMLSAEDRGDTLSEDEVVSNCVLLLFAGHETTTNLLGNGLLHLLENSEQLAALKAEPALAAAAVEEMLRFDAPVPATVKVATRDLEWNGRSIPRGDMVLPFLASANRDPRQFEDADALNIRRRRNRHLAFAYGIHFCLGAPLARLEAQMAFAAILRRFDHLALVEPRPRWKPLLFFRALESLPVAFRA